MLFVSSFFCLGLSLLGGYNKIPLDNDFVRLGSNVIKSKIKVLFPEVQNVDGFDIISARSQVVRGTNLMLKCKYGQVTFCVEMHFPLGSEYPFISSIKGVKHAKPLIGGYNWKEIEDEEKLVNMISELHRGKFGTKINKVTGLREKVIRGTVYSHLIYTDNQSNLYSLIALKSSSDDIEIKYHQKA